MFRIERISQTDVPLCSRKAWEHSGVDLTREKHQATSVLQPLISFSLGAFRLSSLIPVKVTGIAAVQPSLAPSGIKNILSICSQGRLLLCFCSSKWSWVGFVCPWAEHQSLQPCVGLTLPALHCRYSLKKPSQSQGGGSAEHLQLSACSGFYLL